MPLGPVASNEMWDTIYDRLVELVNEHRSTLVFGIRGGMVGADLHRTGRAGSAKKMSLRIMAACRASCGLLPRRN